MTLLSKLGPATSLSWMPTLSQADVGKTVSYYYGIERSNYSRNPKAYVHNGKPMVPVFYLNPGYGKTYTLTNDIIFSEGDKCQFAFIVTSTKALAKQTIRSLKKARRKQKRFTTKDGREILIPDNPVTAQQLRNLAKKPADNDAFTVYVMCNASFSNSGSNSKEAIWEVICNLADIAKVNNKDIFISVDEAHNFMCPWDASEDKRRLNNKLNSGTTGTPTAGTDKALQELVMRDNVWIIAMTATPTPFQDGTYEHEYFHWHIVRDLAQKAYARVVQTENADGTDILPLPSTVFKYENNVDWFSEEELMQSSVDFKSHFIDRYMTDTIRSTLIQSIATVLLEREELRNEEWLQYAQRMGSLIGLYAPTTGATTQQTHKEQIDAMHDAHKIMSTMQLTNSEYKKFLGNVVDIDYVYDIVGNIDSDINLRPYAHVWSDTESNRSNVIYSADGSQTQFGSFEDYEALSQTYISTGDIGSFCAIFQANEGIDLFTLGSVYHLRKHENPDNIHRRPTQVIQRPRPYFAELIGEWHDVVDVVEKSCAKVDTKLANFLRQFLVFLNSRNYAMVDNITNRSAYNASQESIINAKDILVEDTIFEGVTVPGNKIAMFVSNQDGEWVYKTKLPTGDVIITANDEYRLPNLAVENVMSISRLNKAFGNEVYFGAYIEGEPEIEDVLEDTILNGTARVWEVEYVAPEDVDV